MKQKILSLFCIITLIIFLCNFSTTLAESENYPTTYWLDYADDKFAGGDGSEENPYLIETPEQLAYMMIYAEENLNYEYFKITADIDLQGHLWKPAYSFRNNLDGDSYEIKNLTQHYQEEPHNVMGLIGLSYGGEYKNIKIVDCNIVGNGGGGALLGYAIGGPNSVENCSATGTIKGGGSIGGLIGSIDGNGGYIKNSYANVEITATGGLIGGLAGSVIDVSEISDCYASGNVSGTNSVGGLIGRFCESGKIKNSYATGKVIASENFAGGLVGYWGSYTMPTLLSVEETETITLASEKSTSDKGGINYSYALGDIESTGNYVGGLIGYFVTDLIYALTPEYIDYCYAKGNVTGNNYVGGFIGFADTMSYGRTHSDIYVTGGINYCYSIGNVIGNNYVGGFAGENSGFLYSAYTTGKVTGIDEMVGGFIAKYNRFISMQYKDITEYSNGLGAILYNKTLNPELPATTNEDIESTETDESYSYAGKTDAELKSYEILDILGTPFTSDITPNINDGYPILKWQLESAPFEVNFEITDLSKTYTEEELTPTITNDCGMIEGRDYIVKYNESEEVPTEIGIYDISISLTESASEYFTIMGQTTATFEIKEKKSSDNIQLKVKDFELLSDNSILISIFNDKADISGTIFAGIYENSKLIEIEYINKALIEQGDSEFTIKFDTELNKNYFIKSFVWENTENINPISDFLQKLLPLN